jgi:hypothetical protein
MWDDILNRIDWARLHHAYGKAGGVPAILRKMISPDERTRDEGWDHFYGAVNHQGDYYNSTVAAFQFLVEAVKHPEVPGRARILEYFRSRLEDAPNYGGDPNLPDPPGGYDEPTPLVSGPALFDEPAESDGEDGDEEFGPSRPMELCAWQVGRLILAATPTYERLLDDPDVEVAAAAAILLLRRPDTRPAGKRTLARLVQLEHDPIVQSCRILEYGVFADAGDEQTLSGWFAPSQPLVARAAAALAWAWLVDPSPIPEPAAAAVREAADPASDVFERLPWVGVYHRGPWVLPSNAADLPLLLAENTHPSLRWRAVQGLEATREPMRHVPPARVIPVLARRLTDPMNRIRNTAAYGLSQRGEEALDHASDLVARLMAVLRGGGSSEFGDRCGSLDEDATACGHAARLLAAVSHRLSPEQRRDAADLVGRAADRYAAEPNTYVSFDSMGIGAGPFLKQQQELIERPATWGLPELFAAFAWCHNQDTRLPPQECDRRLAEAYAADPAGTVAGAIASLDPKGDRSAALGAGRWLATIGPAAEPALPALDRMATDGPDPYAKEQPQGVAKWIRRALEVTPEPTAARPGGSPDRLRIVVLREAGVPADAAEVLDLAGHPDPFVRCGAAGLLGRLPQAAGRSKEILTALLADEAFAEVGVTGRHECDGRLYHWHRARRSPRAAAIRALFALGHVPRGDRMLNAMLAESARAATVCGDRGTPERFTPAQWDAAVGAAGGFAAAEQRVRTARQAARNTGWSGEDADRVAFSSASELEDVIRRLSGQLV